jgi:lysophospholipase L1-like esterase
MRHDTSNPPGSARNARTELAVKGFVMAVAVPALFALPLFFHHSEKPWIGAYSFNYFLLLIAVAAITFSGAAAVGWWCWHRGDLLPAQTALSVSVASALLFAGGEAFLRWRHSDVFAENLRHGFKRSVLFGFEPIPNHRWQEAGAQYSTDQFGFRSHLSDLRWPEAKLTDKPLRIFVLGGSSAFGYGLNDDETWAHLLETKLRQAAPAWQPMVINAGVDGYNSLQIMLRFYLRVAPHQPTHVLFYEGYNDVKPYVRTIDDMLVAEQILFSSSLADYLAKINHQKNFYLRTILGASLLNRLSQQPGRNEDRNPLRAAPEALTKNGQTFIKNVQALSDFCHRAGVQLICLTFIHDDRNMDRPYVTEALRHYNELLREMAKREGRMIVDLERSFELVPDKAPYFLSDHYHPSRQGAEYIATEVTRALLPMLGK